MLSSPVMLLSSCATGPIGLLASEPGLGTESDGGSAADACPCEVSPTDENPEARFASEGPGSHILYQGINPGSGFLAQILRPGAEDSDYYFRYGFLGSQRSEMTRLSGTASSASTAPAVAFKGASGYLMLRASNSTLADLELWEIGLDGRLWDGGTSPRHVLHTYDQGMQRVGEPAMQLIDRQVHVAWGVCLRFSDEVGTECLHSRDFYQRFDETGDPLDGPRILAEYEDSDRPVLFSVQTKMTTIGARPLVLHVRTAGGRLRVASHYVGATETTIGSDIESLGIDSEQSLTGAVARLALESNGGAASGGAMVCVHVPSAGDIRCALLNAMGQPRSPQPIVLNYRGMLEWETTLPDGFGLLWDDCAYVLTLLVQEPDSEERIPLVWIIDPLSASAREVYRGAPGRWLRQDLLRPTLGVTPVWLRERREGPMTLQDQTRIDCAPLL